MVGSYMNNENTRTQKRRIKPGEYSMRNLPSVLNTNTFDEWLTPFDRMFDKMMTNSFPNFGHEFGVDFFEKGSYPKVNVMDSNKSIIIEAAVPGLTKSDIDIEVLDDILTIQGHKQLVSDGTEYRYVRRELKRSAFKRSFKLGENLNVEKIDASFKDGILILTIPKHKVQVQEKPKKVKIKTTK